MKKEIIWSIIMTVLTLLVFFVTLHFTGNKDQTSYVTIIIVVIGFLIIASIQGADSLAIMISLFIYALIFIIFQIFFSNLISLIILATVISTLTSVIAPGEVSGGNKKNEAILYFTQFAVTLTPMLYAIKA